MTIYKIMPRKDWEAALAAGVYDGSADDRRDGFIHLSAADQVAGTAAKYFVDMPDLVLIAFDPDALGTALKWEPSRGGALFPHLYGPLDPKLAISQLPLPLGPDGVPIVPDLGDG